MRRRQQRGQDSSKTISGMLSRMPHTTESAMEEELNKFKGLASAYSVASRPRLVGTYIAECPLYHPYFANELDDVEAALLRLQPELTILD